MKGSETEPTGFSSEEEAKDRLLSPEERRAIINLHMLDKNASSLPKTLDAYQLEQAYQAGVLEVVEYISRAMATVPLGARLATLDKILGDFRAGLEG